MLHLHTCRSWLEIECRRYSGGRNNCSLSVLLEEEEFGDEKDECDLNGIYDGAKEDSVAQTSGGVVG